MKKKIFILIVTVLFLFSVANVYAGTSLYGYFQGYEKVKILIDGKELDSKVPGFIIDNTTVIPLRAVSEKFNVIVKWDDSTKTANLIQPNVNMQFTANPVYDKDKKTYVVYSPFGKIPKSQRYHFSFYVYSEVDNLPYENVQVKVVLRDPEGQLVQSGNVQSFDATQENSLQYIHYFENVDFISTGNYYVELLLKSESTKNEFVRIGEKLIMVK